MKYVQPTVKRLPSVFKSLLEMRNVVRKEAETSGSKELFETAARMSEKIKSLISKRNRQRWKSFCAEVRTGELSPREFYLLLKRVIGSQRGDAGGIRNSKGEIVNNGEEVREVWRDFFESLGMASLKASSMRSLRRRWSAAFRFWSGRVSRFFRRV